MQELFKLFKDIPEVPSGPMGCLQERGTDLFSYLTARQSNIRDAHTEGKNAFLSSISITGQIFHAGIRAKTWSFPVK